MNQRKLERRSVLIVAACMKARKIQTLIRRAWAMARPKEHPNPASYHITVRDCYAKAFAIIRNKEICQDQEWVSAYFCTSSVVWAGRDVYPTTESLDNLDVSRTGIHHHVMNTTPSHPSMLSHMNQLPCYRFWEFTTSFYISKCMFVHEKLLEYILPTRRV